MRIRLAFIVLGFIFSLTGIGYAQSTNAVISGLVVDSDGRVISGAQIEIQNDLNGMRYAAKTDDSGIYSIALLPPGNYRIQVSKSGFKTLIKPGIVLSVQSALALNFTLPVGATSESVTVESGTNQLNTSDGSVSTVIERDFVANMPLNGRSFQNLLTLAPGVAQVPSYGGSGEGSIGYSGDIVVNGERSEANTFTVDGVSANFGTQAGSFGAGAGVSGNLPVLTSLGTTQGLASIDALEEFRTTTSTYSAEYGRSPGGQFSFMTRSGTNEPHGSLYDYFRNDALDANNWFNNNLGFTKGEERQNDFGGTFGGPIVIPHLYRGTNSTFFFFSYEGLRLDSPQAATQVEVPDADLRTHSPVSLQPLLNAFPIANAGADGKNDGFDLFIDAKSNPSHLNSTALRIDHRRGSRLSLFGRYGDTSSGETAYTEAIENSTRTRTRGITGGISYLIRPNQSNDLRFNYTENTVQVASTSTSIGGAVPLKLGTLPGPNGSGFPEKNSELNAIFTFADFTGFRLGELPTDQEQWNLVDTHAWARGRHEWKAGIDWRRLGTSLASENPVEEVAFTKPGQIVNNTPAAGIAQQFGGSKDKPVYLNFSSFVQDDWKVTPRLSIYAGLRWDVNPAPGNSSGPVPYTVNEVSDLTTIQLAPQGTPLWKTDWLGFAPRFGIAYQLRPSTTRNTVLRGGFGVFYDTGNEEGSVGYQGIGFGSSQRIPNANFPLTGDQLTLPPPSTAAPYRNTVFGFDPNLRLPYSLQYTAAIEQSLSKRDTLTLSYVGSGARRLLTTFLTYPGQIGNPSFASNTDLSLTQGRASSGYNAFQVQYQGSVVQGLQALVSYTWSHSIDDASSNFGIYYLYRASSDFDLRNNLEAAVTYLTPTPASTFKMRKAVENWGVDLRLQARSGPPVDVIGTQTLDPVTGVYLQYQPNLIAGQPLYLRSGSYPGGRIINFNAFASAADGVQGNLPRNHAQAFGALQLDTAVHRDVPLHDSLHLQFRVEAFNILNHPNFGSIYNNLSFGPGQFGYSYATLNNSLGSLDSLYQMGGPRSLQLTLRLAF